VKIHHVLLSAFQTAIANATTLAEVERLKGLLQAGQIPGRERKSGHSMLLLHLFPKFSSYFLLFLLFSHALNVTSLPYALCHLSRESWWKGQAVRELKKLFKTSVTLQSE